MERTHTVDIYRPEVTEGDRGADERRYQLHESGVGCNLQPASGGLRAQTWGREREVSWQGFFPEGTDIREADALKVTDGVGPMTHEVVFVGEQGGEWDVEVDLGSLKESLP